MTTSRCASRLIATVSNVLAMFGTAISGQAASAATAWMPRSEQYSSVVKQSDIAITMSDGTVLRGDLTLPADAAGKAIAGRFPVIMTITAYNKSVTSTGSVNVYVGSRRIKTVSLSGGKAVVSLPAQRKKGGYRSTTKYAGSPTVAASAGRST